MLCLYQGHNAGLNCSLQKYYASFFSVLTWLNLTLDILGMGIYPDKDYGADTVF